MSPDDSFDAAFDGPQYDERAQVQQERWEERIVKEIFKARAQLEGYWALARKVFDRTQRHHLTFDMFISEYGNFPTYLHCQKIPYLHKLTIEQLVKGTKPVTKVFYDLEPDVPARWVDGPRGVVFEWLHSGGGIKILHNHPTVRQVGWRMSWPVPGRRSNKQEFLVLENFNDFLSNTGWREPQARD